MPVSSPRAAALPLLAAGAVAATVALPSAAIASSRPHAQTAVTHAAGRARSGAVTREVRAARAELAVVRANARRHSAVTRRALVRVAAQTHAAAGDALAGAADPNSSSATAAGLLAPVATLLAQEASTYTSLVSSACPGAASGLAAAVKPAVSGATYLTSVLESLAAQDGASATGSTGSTTSTAAGQAAISTVSTLLGQAAGDLSEISSLISSGDLSAQLTGLLGQALSTSTGSVDEIVTQLETLIPDLPSADQAAATQLLGQLQSQFDSAGSELSSASSTLASTVGPQISGQLGEATSWLSGLLSNVSSTIAGLAAGGSSTSTPSASGSGSASTSDTAPNSSLSTTFTGGNLSSLLGSLGLGARPGWGFGPGADAPISGAA